MLGETVKVPPALATPFTVTTTLAAPAGRFGTVTAMLALLQEVTVALTPPKVTMLLP